MSKSCFTPDNWSPSARSREWALSEGFTEQQIKSEMEKMKDHEFRRPYSDWDRVFRNWLRKAVEIGTVTLVESLDNKARDLGITRQPGEDDSSLERRIGIAMTMRAYSLGKS